MKAFYPFTRICSFSRKENCSLFVAIWVGFVLGFSWITSVVLFPRPILEFPMLIILAIFFPVFYALFDSFFGCKSSDGINNIFGYYNGLGKGMLRAGIIFLVLALIRKLIIYTA